MAPISKAHDATWFVARTNPRCEERAASGLTAAGFHVHMPRGVRLVRRRHTKTRRTVTFPLLTGYLFVGIDAATPHFFELRQVDGVASLLGTAGRPLPISLDVVEEFRRLEEIGTFTEDARPKPFSQGERVIVRSGPLAGTVVHFGDYSGRSSARVVAQLFGQHRTIDIPLDALSKTGGRDARA